MIYEFEDYSLDVDRQELRRGTDAVNVEPQVLDLLQYIIRCRDRVVSKEELIANIWRGRHVSESTLTSRITSARKAVGDDGNHQRLIRTVSRKGIRFVGAIGTDASAPDATAGAIRFADKPSIAVLAFTNMSGDPEQEYFADGMVEEIITGLSRIRWLLVIARNSSFIYKNRPVSIKEVAATLGVRYVLEGSVRKGGHRVRISAQLIDSETGAHIWAEQYERPLEDVFAIQDEITMRVVGAIEPSLRKAEIDRVKRQRPSNINAYDMVLRALPFVYAGLSTESSTYIPLLESALKLEPNYGAAHAVLSWCFHSRFVREGRRKQDRLTAVRHARAAVADGSDDPMALSIAAFVISIDERDTETAIGLFDRALSISRGNIFALSCSAVTLAWLGNADIAIERAQLALRLSPFDSLNWRSSHALAISHFQQGHYGDAVEAARNAINANPNFSLPRAILAAALIRLGRDSDARTAAQAVLHCQPSFTIQEYSVTSELNPVVFGRFAEAWREIGLPT